MSRSKKSWDHLVDYNGNYAIDIKKGLWPGSGLMQKGDKGPEGAKGDRGRIGPQGRNGDKGDVGEKGAQGFKGEVGPDGLTAYELAVKGGFIGSEQSWLSQLKGDQGVGVKGEAGDSGTSAYQEAVKGGFVGNEFEWLESLKGEQGVKGEAQGLFFFQGAKPDLPSIEGLDPNGSEIGDVWLDSSTDNLYVWDGNSWVLLSEALDVVKGEKGIKGEEGKDGTDAYDSAVKGGFVGSEAAWAESLKGPKGNKGEDGSSSYDIYVKGFQPVPGGDPLLTEDEWLETLKGELGDEGEKGEKGVQGIKGDFGLSAYEVYAKGEEDAGTDPIDILDEVSWLESLKGDQGDAADPHDLDDYYTKGQVNQKLSQLPDPEDSYDINYMNPSSVFLPGEAADFNSTDQNDRIYNKGIVSIGAGVTSDSSPLRPPFSIINYVLRDVTRLRASDYLVAQEIHDVKETGGKGTYYRVACPGQAEFSPWFQTSFDASLYYDKTDVNDLVAAISYDLGHKGGDLTLTDKDGGESAVKVYGTGGVSVVSTVKGLEIDASLISGHAFLGTLQDTDDPNLRHATLNIGPKTAGQFFIYNYTGKTINTDPNTLDCTPGDWCIYSESDSAWKHLDMSQDPGVVDLDVAGGLLTVDKSNPSVPVIGLDANDITSALDLDIYLTKSAGAAALSNLNLDDLNDVDISHTRVLFGASISHASFAVNLGDGAYPQNNGERSTDISQNQIFLAKKDTAGTDADVLFYNNVDVNDNTQIVRITHVASNTSTYGNATAKSSSSDYVSITFATPNEAMFAAAAEGALVFDIVTRDANNGDILSYDAGSLTWKTSAGDFVSKSGDTMSGNLNFMAGVDINFIGNNTGINLESPYWGGLKYDGQLVFEWKADAIQAGRDLNMKLGNVDFLSLEAESQYAGSDQHGGHSIQWLKAPSHKYDATNKEWVENKIQSDINFNNYTELT